MTDHYAALKACLACGSPMLHPILDLGSQPLANSYHAAEEVLPSFALGVNLCPACYHVQQFVAVDPDLMFKQYAYVSGTSNTLREYFDWFADMVEKRVPAGGKRVLDIACNDGSQLIPFMRRGWKGFGVDPAENLIEQSRATGASVACDYWNESSARKLGGTFDVLIAQNVFAHVADPFSFLKACHLVMEGESKLFIQTSQAEMFSRGEFDTIYHEHISFFSTRSMQELARRAGLTLEDVFITPVHGGSYVFVLGRSPVLPSVGDRLAVEEAGGRYGMDLYERFGNGARASVGALKEACERASASGRAVIGFGAAAKGNTVLNFGGIALDYIVDDNPLKQGLLTPGMNIPIRAPRTLADEAKPATIVVLAWNFYDEIHGKVKAIRSRADDVFVTYFPEIRERS